MRAFGTDFRRVLDRSLSTRLRAFLAGLGITGVLQSSTATALMTTSLAAAGLMDLDDALAVMLGANVGTTLIVQVLSFDITLLFPILIVGGLIAFRRGGTTRIHDLGRVAIGLGLMLLSLHLLGDTVRPAEESRAAREILTAITGDPILNFALAALFAWAAHSSVAVMLTIISLAATGITSPEATLAMVLGANIGTSINPILEGTNGDPVKLRVPVGNFAMRAALAVVLLPLLGPMADFLAGLEPNPGRMAADAHTAFNVAVAIVFIGLLPFVGRLLVRLLPEQERTLDPAAPLYLDRNALDTPAVALANAAREVLRMADIVEIHADRRPGRVAQRRPQAHRRDQPHGRSRRPPPPGASAVPVVDRPKRTGRGRVAAALGDPGLCHQPGAHRRYHRPQPQRTDRQADAPEAQPVGGRPQ